MSYSKEDLLAIADEAQRELTKAKTKLSTLRTGIAALPIPEASPRLLCPQCEIPFNGTDKGRQLLNEHMENVHGVIAV